MKAKLKQRHIDKGIRSSSSCPFALLVGELFKEKNPSVGHDNFIAAKTGRVAIAPEIAEKIKRFDDTGKMEPCELEFVENPKKGQYPPYILLKLVEN